MFCEKHTLLLFRFAEIQQISETLFAREKGKEITPKLFLKNVTLNHSETLWNEVFCKSIVYKYFLLLRSSVRFIAAAQNNGKLQRRSEAHRDVSNTAATAVKNRLFATKKNEKTKKNKKTMKTRER